MSDDLIYTDEDFLVDLTEYYGKFPEGVITRISEWVSETGVRGYALRAVYKKITETFKAYSYKTKPELNDIVATFQTIGMPQSRTLAMAEKSALFVLEHLDRISSKRGSRGWDSLEVGEKEIYHDYSDLANIRDLGKENKMPDEFIDDILVKAKELLDKKKGVFHFYQQVASPRNISDKLIAKKESGLKKIGG